MSWIYIIFLTIAVISITLPLLLIFYALTIVCNNLAVIEMRLRGNNKNEYQT